LKVKATHLLVAAIIILIASALAVFLLLKKPGKKIEWTQANCLLESEAPVLIDPGDSASLLVAIDYSLRYLDKLPQDQTFTFGPRNYSLQTVKDSLLDFKAKVSELGTGEKFLTYVKEHYKFFKSAAPIVLYTGYYEATLRGSKEQSETYAYPLYKKPDDLVDIDLTQYGFYGRHKGLPRVIRGRLGDDNKVVPYHDREAIETNQILAGKDLEFVWIDDPIDVFFLQIQGSGIVQLDSGESMRVNYAGTNGHPFRAIGRLLVQRNLLELEEASMQGIRGYLEAHPEEMEEIFNTNPSYIFFREVPEGPIGSIGVPVTPYRSIATDRYLFPRGVLCYIELQLPTFDQNNQMNGTKDFSAFVLNQDTGGAIRTPSRVDLFCGNGPANELTAGHLKQPGTLYFLIKQ
jgi:membrane-bound lytic murein transglycosylase A